jgi:purine nucleosidase
MRKIIIDTDPGIDDAVAIIAASFVEEFELLGICTVAGNVAVEHCTNNALGLMQFLKRDIPVYEGADTPISTEPDLSGRAKSVHGENGIGGVVLSFEKQKSAMSAVDFILESAKKYPDELEIITLGPVTNIALAIQKDFEAMKKVKAIWTMGGGYGGGNVTPYAEFNFWADAKALELFLDLGKYVDIHMYGLDVTHKSQISYNELLFIGAFGEDIGKLILDMSLTYARSYFNRRKKLSIVIHDLLTVMACFKPDLCTYNHCIVETRTTGERLGQTICDLSHELSDQPNIYLAVDVDAKEFKKQFVKLVFPAIYHDFAEYVVE